MENNCVFCKIINNEIPSLSIYEDDDFKVIMDISPASKGHAVLMPKKHVKDLFDLDDHLASKALVIAKKLAIVMKDELECDGFNLLQNNNGVAGQTVFHFHIHLIPRYKNDGILFTWESNGYKEGEVDNIVEAIKKRL